MFLISVRSNRCVKKLLKKIYGYCGKWTKRCVKKLLKKIHMHWNMSLISENIMPKKCLKRQWLLEYIPSQCITQELRRWGGEEKRFALPYVFNQYMTQETCERAVEKDPWWLKNHWKIFLISIRPRWYVKELLKRKRLLEYIPDQCITQEILKELLKKLLVIERYYESA